jgi:predicted CoA-substrate-specific enzyme activase
MEQQNQPLKIDNLPQQTGNICGYTCTYVPLEILYAAGYVPYRVIGRTDLCSQTDSMLSGNLCPYVHTILDMWRRYEDEWESIVITDSCDAMKSLYQVLSLETDSKNRLHYLCPPRSNSEHSIRFYSKQLRLLMGSLTGARPEACNDALWQAIELYDALRSRIEALHRAARRPKARFFSALRQKLYSSDPQAMLQYLEDNQTTLGTQASYTEEGVKIAVIGSPIPGDMHLSIVEEAGFDIVTHDSCLNERWDPQPAPGSDGNSDPFTYLARRYLDKVSCPRMQNRHTFLDSIIREYRAGRIRGIIHFRMPFCDLHGFDYARLLAETGGEHIIQIETDGSRQSEGQVATRVQAFYELLTGESDPAGVARSDRKSETHASSGAVREDSEAPVYCGIDVGSATVDGVLIEDGGSIISSGIKKTGPGAEKTAYALFHEMLADAGLSEQQVGCITATGYGREAITFAHHIVTEITCHARGALQLMPAVRFVIDIGGQDSKVIRINRQGKVDSFQMNDKCAAGTGRFLDVMAGALEMSLDEINRYGTQEGETAAISSVCTVFAESEVVNLIARGVAAPDITRGIFAAIARRIAGMVRRVGLIEPVMMTGGGSLNRGLVKNMEDQLEVSIHVPEIPQLVGALGAAILGKAETEEVS